MDHTCAGRSSIQLSSLAGSRVPEEAAEEGEVDHNFTLEENGSREHWGGSLEGRRRNGRRNPLGNSRDSGPLDEERTDHDSEEPLL